MAAGHVGVRGARVARVDVGLRDLLGQLVVVRSAQAVVGIALAGADVARQAGEGAAADADGVAVGVGDHVAKVVFAAEHVEAAEVACVQGLVPPGHGAVEAALFAEDLLEGPEEIAVPDDEVGVAVDVGHVPLMQADEILISVRGWGGEPPDGGFAHQAFDRSYESQPVGGRVVPPFDSGVGVILTGGCGGGLHTGS